MKALEVDTIIRKTAPSWLLDEIDNLINTGKVELWEDPPTDCIECLDMFSCQDWAETTKYKNAIKKIDKALGILVQVEEGEEVCTMSGHMRVGQWRYIGSYYDLIEGKLTR